MFSVIIPWKSGNKVREEHLANMLNCFTKQNPEIPFEIIVVEQVIDGTAGYCNDVFSSLLPELLATKARYIQLKNEDVRFNKSWCMNVGARLAQYDNLIFADADSLFGSTFLDDITNYINTTQEPHKHLFSCWTYVVCMPGKDNPIVRYMRNDDIRTLGAIWFANKDFYFNKFGGMNENFIGYGAEDNEAYSRAVNIMNCTSLNMLNYVIVHQYHDWEPYNKLASDLFDKCMINPHETIRRIIKAGVGKQECPSYINTSDFIKGGN